MITQRELTTAAERLARLLTRRGLRIVFAESCTGGLVSATLARIPGISEYHCGSAVVYRMDTKHRWLGIPAAVLRRPGPVSRQVATAMATNVLRRTPEADIAASVTGHLGPGAPRRQDGLIYAAVALGTRPNGAADVDVLQHRLDSSPASGATSGRTLRRRRQREAAWRVLTMVHARLEDSPDF